MGWQQRDGARPERWRWRDFERERESGWGREACTALSQETALPALRGRRHDNHHGCRCHSFITPLSSPSPPIPRSLSLSPPPSPSLRLVFLSPLSSLASFTSHPGLLSLLLSLLLLPFKHSEWGKKHPDEKMAVVFHLYSRCV